MRARILVFIIFSIISLRYYQARRTVTTISTCGDKFEIVSGLKDYLARLCAACRRTLVDALFWRKRWLRLIAQTVVPREGLNFRIIPSSDKWKLASFSRFLFRYAIYERANSNKNPPIMRIFRFISRGFPSVSVATIPSTIPDEPLTNNALRANDATRWFHRHSSENFLIST